MKDSIDRVFFLALRYLEPPGECQEAKTPQFEGAR